MASLTPMINNTFYDTKPIDGALKFNIFKDKIYFNTDDDTIVRKITIVSPPTSLGTIILNDIKFSESNIETRTDSDLLYYDTLNYQIQLDGSTRNMAEIIPRTEYLEKTFYPSTTDYTILTFTNSIISELDSELDIRIVDSNNNFIEPINLSVVDGTCVVTVPPCTTTDEAICRIYIYNPNDFSNT